MDDEFAYQRCVDWLTELSKPQHLFSYFEKNAKTENRAIGPSAFSMDLVRAANLTDHSLLPPVLHSIARGETESRLTERLLEQTKSGELLAGALASYHEYRSLPALRVFDNGS